VKVYNFMDNNDLTLNENNDFTLNENKDNFL
jgi:hypothetical protein